MPRAEFIGKVASILEEVHVNLLNRAKSLRKDNTQTIKSFADFKNYFTPKDEKNPEIHGGFALCHSSGGPEIEGMLKDLKVTARCIPLDHKHEPGTCVFTGKPATQQIIYAKSY